MKKVLFVFLSVFVLSSCSVSNKIPLKKSGEIFIVDVTLQDYLTIPFIVDTGATDCSISVDVLMVLHAGGKISKYDLIGEKNYTLADGSKITQKIVVIRKLKIGNKVFENVDTSISLEEGSPLILGQNVLSQMGVLEIDYLKNTIKVK